jgi:hypothetical protein
MNAHLISTWLALAIAGVVGVNTRADGPPVKPFDHEQVKGDVRVVLLRVDRSTVFTKSNFQSETNTIVHAVPGIGITCVVEALGSEPKQKWLTPEVEIYANGRRLSETAENLAAGGTAGLSEFTSLVAENKPVVKDAKRAVVYKDWKRGLRVPSGKIDLHLTTGFNEHKETFVFKDIPLE